MTKLAGAPRRVCTVCGLILITKKKWRKDLVDDPHAMYCSAFVRHCYKEAVTDFLGPGVSISNTTPEHIAQAGIKASKLIRYSVKFGIKSQYDS